MALESSLKQQPKQLTPASNVNFECEDGIINFNNGIALLECKNASYYPMLQFLSNSCISTALTKQPATYYSKYLRKFWYMVEVDDVMKSISFTLSDFDKPLSYIGDEFSSIIGLKSSENYVPLPPKETVRSGLATLGLVDVNDTSFSSTDLVRKTNICYTRYLSLIIEHLLGDAYNKKGLSTFKPPHISATSFKTPYENKVPLTAHMCNVAKLLPEPIKSLIPPFGDVNADDITDKSLSGTNVQPVTQSKVTTDRKSRKKKILASSTLKTLKIIRDSSPQVVDTQHAEEPATTGDATQSIDASEPAEELGNQPEQLMPKRPTKRVQKPIDEEIMKESGIKLLGNVSFVDLSLGAHESPYDTESEIKVVDVFQKL
ncbi:hypothetical protein Tco_0732292 [Tanacetum coccineum]